MAVKKGAATTPAKAPAKAPVKSVVVPEIKDKPEYETKKFTAKVARMWHPDQKVYIDLLPVALEMDSWTVCQVEAGLLIEV